MHRDISFRNVRVDEQNKVCVCDFDMATVVDSVPSAHREHKKTGTVAFMEPSILSGYHNPAHDCESVFWICALGPRAF